MSFEQDIAIFEQQQRAWGDAVREGLLDPREVMATVQVVVNREVFVTVNRHLPPSYPKEMTHILYPTLEVSGPENYDIRSLVECLHPAQESGVIVPNTLGQVTGAVAGHVIHEYLNVHDLLQSCLGLHDLEAIRKKGYKFFRKHFQSKTVFAWQSIVCCSDGALKVPCLIGLGGDVFICWRNLDQDWHVNNPALHFT